MRLNKFVGACLGISRRKADSLILENGVVLNGVITKDPGTPVVPGKDKVAYSGKALYFPDTKYYILNKPAGYLCSRMSQGGKPTIYDLLPEEAAGLDSAGRLDLDSSGLLIFTNDGELTQLLTHPSHGHEKEYIVEVKWFPRIGEAVEKLNSPVTIEDGYTAKAKVSLGKKTGANAALSFILTTGHKRQIRMMCRAAGLMIVSLTRIRTGKLPLPANLPSGKGRFITRKEAYKAAG
ncbi:MAG: rRNA pseudouridine synthase [Chloroflexi bacterium]|nr:rRNA pseudouridine synthase [Chloroflexota bacterium]